MVDRIQNDLKEAQLARNEIKVSTLRLLLSEINNAKIAKGQELIEEDILVVIGREVKKRKEAAAGFRTGGRETQAQKEESEGKILSRYIIGTAQISDEELTGVVSQSITEVGAKSLADMGKVMGVVMGKVKGQADGGRVSAKVLEKLQ